MTEKIKTNEIFSIPNILCYLRFILIPVFCTIYLNADETTDYYIAAGILITAALTDWFDGFIARKFDMITDLGKVIDPIADKMMQAAIGLCLCKKYPFMWLLIGVLLIKESYMVIKGIVNLKKGKKINGAMWFGKVCTAVLFITMIALVVFPVLPLALVHSLIIINIIIMLFTLVMYAAAFRKTS